ncbi:molybdopterin molybdotransferase MoeA [Granulosicoccaceae sp. 1_MG-2023]|nr:molybdopterin molybdotransferase MoeA [Granulosicoccaceae sp. 1_MG-2023]
MIEKQPSCADDKEPGLLPVSEALQRIYRLVPRIQEAESVPLREALGRVLAADVASRIDVPGYTNSAMDGYAICSADLPAEGEASLTITGSAFAGRPFDGQVGQGEAVRIMTGAVMPDGADTVVIQERCEADGDMLRIDGSTAPAANVRYAGEDVRKGETILEAGELLMPAHLGMLASLGVSEVKVTRRLKVAFMSTGDELLPLDGGFREPARGEIFDSNRYSIYGMLSRLGVEVIDLGVVRDEPGLIGDAFQRAAAQADVVISSGGVSVGEADFVSDILHRMGDVAFWKLAMRPGRPLACGKLGDAVFFGLPGNPVAVMVAFYEFVQPALRTMSGVRHSQSTPPRFRVRSTSELRKSEGRTEFQRGILYTDESGETVVRSTGKQGAGRLSSMCSANCIIVIDPGRGNIQAGEYVEVQPFHGLV